MNVALYARVSSEKQAEKDLSLPAQIKALRDYAVRKDWVISREFIDEAESARTVDRPAFQQMISEAKQKDSPFKAIVVWKLNRFARNREDSIIYKSLLRKRGVQVISINENFDDGPTGKLLEGIIESIDEFYSANLSQDTIRGMRENILRGFWNGGCIPYGYKNIVVETGKDKKHHKLEVIPTEATVVQRIFALCHQGKGFKEIVKTLNAEGIMRRSGTPWRTSNIAYMLGNETYTGCLVWKEYRHNPRAKDRLIRVPDTHPLIISLQLFKATREVIKSRSNEVVPPRAVGSDHLLSSLLLCKECNRSMAVCGAKSGAFHYYTCQRYVKMGRAYCSQKRVNTKKLEVFIVNLLKERVFTHEHVKDLFLRVNTELSTFEKNYESKLTLIDASLTDKLTRRKKLYNKIETDAVDLGDLGPRLRELNAEIECLKLEKEELEKMREGRQPITITESELNAYVEELRVTLTAGTISERKGFIRSFIKKIVVGYPNIEVQYTVPLPVGCAKFADHEVLHLVQNGDPNGIRTRVITVKG